MTYRQRRAPIWFTALLLAAAGCTADDPPALDIDPTRPGITSDTLPNCAQGGPDETTPAAGCLDPDGRVLRP